MSKAPKPIDHAAERQRLLDKLDMITEEELAVLLDGTVKTLTNRDQRELPPSARSVTSGCSSKPT